MKPSGCELTGSSVRKPMYEQLKSVLSRLDENLRFAIRRRNVIGSGLEGGEHKDLEGIEVEQKVGCREKRGKDYILSSRDCNGNGDVGTSWYPLFKRRAECQSSEENKSPSPKDFNVEHSDLRAFEWMHNQAIRRKTPIYISTGNG